MPESLEQADRTNRPMKISKSSSNEEENYFLWSVGQWKTMFAHNLSYYCDGNIFQKVRSLEMELILFAS